MDKRIKTMNMTNSYGSIKGISWEFHMKKDKFMFITILQNTSPQTKCPNKIIIQYNFVFARYSILFRNGSSVLAYVLYNKNCKYFYCLQLDDIQYQLSIIKTAHTLLLQSNNIPFSMAIDAFFNKYLFCCVTYSIYGNVISMQIQ